MNKVKLGVIGCGTMGGMHISYFDKVTGLKLTALADTDPKTLKSVAEGHDVQTFDNGYDLIDNAGVDAVLIATPHYDHPRLAIAGLKKGLHVLVEKPVAVTAKAADEMNEVAKAHPDRVFAAMFQQRTNPEWRYVKKAVEEGRLGEMMRVNWTITSWFRTQAYYNSGGWRATWEGEGGGVLLNQCPHNLDLFQWFVGMPSKVTANVGLGKHHHIEVEDDVTAILEFDNGATGTFITSTGQSPGINRLEIVGDKATLIFENGQPITLLENETPVRQFCRQSEARFASPKVTRSAITPGGNELGHRGITQNFINAILHDEPLIAHATEGIRGLELGNAMLMSGLTGQTVNLPTDREAYDQLIRKLASESDFKKDAVRQVDDDFAASF